MSERGPLAPSFATLLGEPATIVRNTAARLMSGPDAPTFKALITPNAKQQRAPLS